jgi:hypothetical protein
MKATEFVGLTKRERFLVLISFGALARDVRQGGSDAQAIAQVAWQIEEAKMPKDVAKAANTFLEFFRDGNNKMPAKWMLIGIEQAMLKADAERRPYAS